jgi:hypothetical protein
MVGKAESRNQKSESRKQKAESRKQKFKIGNSKFSPPLGRRGEGRTKILK